MLPSLTRRLPGPRAALALLLAAAAALQPTLAAAPAASPSAGSAPAAAAAASPAASAPPVSVTLVRAQPRDFTVRLDATGTVVPLRSVEVKPQVSSQVLQVHVQEGQTVQRGQLLFTLDARTEQANLKKAEAQLLKDQATLADARRQLARSQELVAQNFISQGALDTALANVQAQQAVLAADQAALDAVKVQLSYSRVTAPGAGRVGPIVVYAGSSVSPTGPALLTITQMSPVAVAFSLPQRHLPDALAALKAAAKPGGGGQVTASLPAQPGAAPLSRQGRLVFVDSMVDAASGTVKVKASFDNADLALWPGAFVNVAMALQTLPGAIVVPQAAIVQGARGTVVFVAEAGNRAAMRPVKVLAAEGTDAVVSGLKAGERVVLDGRQNVRPGSTLVERQADGAGRRGGAAAAPRAASGAAPGSAAASAPPGADKARGTP